MATSLLQRLPKAWRALTSREEKASDPLEVLREIFGAQRESWAGKTVTLRTVLQVSAAVACGRVISEGLAMLPLKILQQLGREIKPALKHPMYDKFAVKPNELQSAFEFKEQMGLHLAFCGNAFVWIPRVSGRIDQLLLLEPRWVTIICSWPQPPVYRVVTDEGATFNLSAQEVWQIRGPSWATYMGLEFIRIAREALGLSMAIEETQSRMQGQGVQTSGFLSVEGTLQEDQQKKLRKWIEDEHTGSMNAGRAMILDRAAKWMTTAMSNVDAQTIETRELQIEEVCRFMRVMPIMVGVSRKVATYASSEQMFLAHLVHTLGPWVARIESSMDRWILSDADRAAGHYSKFNEKALHRMTAVDQMSFLTSAVSYGVYTRNEARAKLDENPLPGLDEPLTPVNEVAGPPPKAKPAAAPAETPAPEDALQ